MARDRSRSDPARGQRLGDPDGLLFGRAPGVGLLAPGPLQAPADLLWRRRPEGTSLHEDRLCWLRGSLGVGWGVVGESVFVSFVFLVFRVFVFLFCFSFSPNSRFSFFVFGFGSVSFSFSVVDFRRCSVFLFRPGRVLSQLVFNPFQSLGLRCFLRIAFQYISQR